MGTMAERLGKRVDRFGSSRGHYYNDREIEQYERGWSKMMIDIWREKIQQLNINDSGALQNSMEELVTTGQVTTIEHKFLQYGLFVAAGVGKGFAHGNGGDLLFMGEGVGKGFDIDGKIYRDKAGNVRKIGSNPGDLLFMGDSYREGKRAYGSRQVGAGLSEEHMKSPKFEHVTVQRGPNKGKEAALTSGEKRMPRDWFFKKYYYSIRRLNLTESAFYGRAYQGLMSSFLDELFSGGIRSNRF